MPLSLDFEACWRALKGSELVTEYRFDPQRRWRFDYCHPASKVAIELDGATWTSGRHVRGAGYARDCEKLNAALEQGWLVYRLTADMVRNDPMGWVERIKATIERRTS